MPRIRYLKPETPLDEELAQCSLAARLFFRDLWCHCDREGRCEDRPLKLKALIFPYEAVDVDGLLIELCPRFLVRYEANSRRYLQVLNFTKHQKPHHTEQRSAIPPPSKEVLKGWVSSVLTVDTPLLPGRNGDGNGDGNGENNRDAVDKLVRGAAKQLSDRDLEVKLNTASIPFSFGDFPRGVRLLDLPADTLQAVLDRTPRLGSDLTKLLVLAIKAKKAEKSR